MKVTGYMDPLTLSIDIAQEREKALVLWEMEKRKKTSGGAVCSNFINDKTQYHGAVG